MERYRAVVRGSPMQDWWVYVLTMNMRGEEVGRRAVAVHEELRDGRLAVESINAALYHVGLYLKEMDK